MHLSGPPFIVLPAVFVGGFLALLVVMGVSRVVEWICRWLFYRGGLFPSERRWMEAQRQRADAWASFETWARKDALEREYARLLKRPHHRLPPQFRVTATEDAGEER
jgi:hypothetical protein